MTKEQEIFWKEIQEIQDVVVNVSLSNFSKYDNMKKLLEDVTYETICRLMELLDGLRNNNIKGDIICLSSESCINSDIQLHDYCEEYLNCSEI